MALKGCFRAKKPSGRDMSVLCSKGVLVSLLWVYSRRGGSLSASTVVAALETADIIKSTDAWHATSGFSVSEISRGKLIQWPSSSRA